MAEKNFFVHADGNQNELQNWSLQKLAADPGVPFQGQFWHNTTDNRYRWYDGVTVHTLAHLSDVVGSVTFKGGYDAATNTPNLDSAPAAGTIDQGDFYYVTAAGNFYTEPVEIGDALIANIDNPAALSDWTRVQFNVDQATETTRGVAEIATQAETNAGLIDTDIVTPLKLVTYINSLSITEKFAVDLDSVEATVARVFAGGETTFTVTHSLGTSDVLVQVREIASGKEVIVDIEIVDANTTDIIFNGNIADGVYRIVVIG